MIQLWNCGRMKSAFNVAAGSLRSRARRFFRPNSVESSSLKRIPAQTRAPAISFSMCEKLV
jgi:hypothetical protein